MCVVCMVGGLCVRCMVCWVCTFVLCVCVCGCVCCVLCGVFDVPAAEFPGFPQFRRARYDTNADFDWSRPSDPA